MQRSPSVSHRRPLGACALATAALVAALLAAAWPSRASAQGGDWPTLAGAGLEYVSESGLLQVSLSGQLDLEALHLRDSWAGLVSRRSGDVPLTGDRPGCATCHVGMGLRGDGGALASYRLRLFADIFLGDHVYALVEGRSDRGHAPSDDDPTARVEQAYVRVSDADGGAGVQVGRFASPFGSYALRHLTPADPFLRPPLGYDYRTVMSRNLAPANEALLLEWRHATEFFRKPGVPPVWDVPYQWGAMIFGQLGPFDARVAALNSSPSSDPEAWGFDADRFSDPSWVAAVRTRPTAEFDVGLSWSKGPWMEPLTGGSIGPPEPGGRPPGYRDFDQEIVSVDVAYARGPVTLRAEAMLDRWEVPNVVDRPTERVYHLEVQSDLAAGFSVAGRVGHIDFRPLDDGAGAARPWDHDVTRLEAAVGYRLARNAGLLLSGFEQLQRGAADADGRLLGLRLWWAF